MNQKGLAPIVIVILVAIGIGGYLLYQNQFKSGTSSSQQTVQPTPSSVDETADWKLFKDDKYNFNK